MAVPTTPSSNVPIRLLVLLCGAVCGVAAGLGLANLFPATLAPGWECPLPHHVPKYPGVASLRFAMVHDVVTERYAKHGPTYYEERNRLTRIELEKAKAAFEPAGPP